MPIDTWFPLAIYYDDLIGAETHNAEIAAAMRRLINGVEAKRTTATTAFTGDVHGIEQIHNDAAFAWITRQVEFHALNYLSAIGHDLDKIDLYCQRSWPIISQAGEAVPVHAHHTANVSAVYYVELPADGDAGALRFHNQHRPNEVSDGIATSLTQGYSTYNVLNFGDAVYAPRAGRLLLFPAKQSHSVDKNESEGERLSLSFDLLVTSREEAEPGRHEYLTPPPGQWRRCTRYEDFLAEMEEPPTGSS